MSSPGRGRLIDACINQLLAPTSDISDISPGGHFDDQLQDTKSIQNAEDSFASSEMGADTLVIVAIGPGFGATQTCRGYRFPSRWKLQLLSKTLRESGFAKFDQLLDDGKYQARLFRRLTNNGEKIPSGIKYIIDMGPSTDEDMRTQQLEALSVPEGIRRWYLMCNTSLDIPASLTAGHDDSCTCSYAQESPKEKGALKNTESLWDVTLGPDYRSTTDYCELRHATNAVRLLLQIHGQGLHLNSAIRVYTLAGLARLFDMDPFSQGAHVFRTAVDGWLFRGDNHTIVEILPEAAFRIGWNLKHGTITRAAYRILVAERAVQAGAENAPLRRPKESFVGRLLEEVDEDTETILQHATRSYTDRILRDFRNLFSDNALDYFGNMHEWSTLCNHIAQVKSLNSCGTMPHPVTGAFQTFKETLLEILHSFVTNTLHSQPDDSQTQDIETKLKRYVKDFKDRSSYRAIYEKLEINQKVLTGTFWQMLSSFNHFPPTVLGEARLRAKAADFNTAWRDAFVNKFETTEDGQPIARPLFELVRPNDWPFNVERFLNEMVTALREYGKSRYDEARYDADEGINYTMSNHLLLGIGEPEFRFLPLWAGGFDDGTGGVFQDPLPAAELGPTGPGPAYHTGYTVAAATDVDGTLDFENLGLSDSGTETARSVVAQDGISTVHDRQVILTPEQSIASERFTQDSDDDFQEAIRQSRASRDQEIIEELLREEEERDRQGRQTGILIEIEEEEGDEQTEQSGEEITTDGEGEATPSVTTDSDFSLI